MTCERWEELVSAWLEGELGPKDRAAFEEHRDRCAACASLLAAVARTRDVLVSFPQADPSPALARRLAALPAREAAPAERTRRRFSLLDVLLRPSLQPVYAGAAAILMAVTFFGFAPQSRSLKKAIDRTVHDGVSRVERLYVKAESLGEEVDAYRQSVLSSLRKDEDSTGKKN